MVRGTSIVLGAGLIILWLVGLGNNASAWLTWLDGAAALCAFGIAAAIVPDRIGVATAVGAPIALAVGLYVLWIVALAVGSTPWLAWWTFAFACAFLILGLLAIGGERTTTTMAHPRTV
jgi:hypothetical protein